jgi:hypothetical protein
MDHLLSTHGLIKKAAWRQGDVPSLLSIQDQSPGAEHEAFVAGTLASNVPTPLSTMLKIIQLNTNDFIP